MGPTTNEKEKKIKTSEKKMEQMEWTEAWEKRNEFLNFFLSKLSFSDLRKSDCRISSG